MGLHVKTKELVAKGEKSKSEGKPKEVSEKTIKTGINWRKFG